MRIAIIYNDNDLYVEFEPEKFRAILKEYLIKYGNIDAALDMVISDLRKEALYR